MPPAQTYGRQQPKTQAGGGQSSQQRMIVIAAAAVVLFLVLVCVIVGITQRKTIQNVVTGVIDPAARKTQIAKDIEIGLTQTAAVSVNVPATVQAQIQMTQAAGGQLQAPAQPPPAGDAQQPAQAQGGVLTPEEKAYIDAVNQNLAIYDQAVGKISQLMQTAQQDTTKLKDGGWNGEFSTTATQVSQASQALNSLTAPQNLASLHEMVLGVARNYDKAIELGISS
jgi:uncharacterized protein YukE